MRVLHILFFLFGLSCVTCAGPVAIGAGQSLQTDGFSDDEHSLRRILMHADSTLKDVRIIRCKTDPQLFIAILVQEEHWWESLAIVHFMDHHIDWQATIDSLPTSQAIFSAREVALTGFTGPMIEVFDITHMGNGYYYLYRIHGRHARLLLQTRAVDRNMDGGERLGDSVECSEVFKNDHLTPAYMDINHDGYADISLSGVTMLYAQDDKTLLKQWPVRKIFLYSKTRDRFIPVSSRRKRPQ